jgi:iron-only hydrogenase group A
VAIGEMFGLEHGTVMTGQMVAALRRLGFDRVFDTNFSADLTIMEEASELVQRMQTGGPLPLITSCSPGWVKYAEHFYPDQLHHLSTCKSPQQMFGAVAKTYYAEKIGIDPANIVSVAIMPCTAKKFEAARTEMNASGCQDVDYVLTTRELGRMIKQRGINLKRLPAEEYDAPLGISTGAGQIFGVTGGVMEAALRTAAVWLGGENLPRLTFTEVRGEVGGIKEATVVIGGNVFRLAIANGLAAAGRIMEKIQSGESQYHFVEIMGCPGGCIGGGGQPIPEEGPDALEAVRLARITSVYSLDELKTVRRSHENPAIQALYREFLGAPLSHKSHELLHTQYTRRDPVGVRIGEQVRQTPLVTAVTRGVLSDVERRPHDPGHRLPGPAEHLLAVGVGDVGHAVEVLMGTHIDPAELERVEVQHRVHGAGLLLVDLAGGAGSLEDDRPLACQQPLGSLFGIAESEAVGENPVEVTVKHGRRSGPPGREDQQQQVRPCHVVLEGQHILRNAAGSPFGEVVGHEDRVEVHGVEVMNPNLAQVAQFIGRRLADCGGKALGVGV